MKKLIFSFALFILLTSSGLWLARQNVLKKRQASISPLVYETSTRYGLRPSFVFALIKKESNFQINARGKFQEYGLMQIREGVADDWCREHKRDNFRSYGILMDPKMNIEIGTWYLAKGIKRWKGYKHQEQIALAQYNAGPGRVKEWIPPTKEGEFLSRVAISSTRDYIVKIQRYDKEFLEQFKTSSKK